MLVSYRADSRAFSAEGAPLVDVWFPDVPHLGLLLWLGSIVLPTDKVSRNLPLPHPTATASPTSSHASTAHLRLLTRLPRPNGPPTIPLRLEIPVLSNRNQKPIKKPRQHHHPHQNLSLHLPQQSPPPPSNSPKSPPRPANSGSSTATAATPGPP